MLIHKLKPNGFVKVGDTKIFNLGEKTCSLGIDGPEPMVYPQPPKEPLPVDKDAFDVVG